MSLTKSGFFTFEVGKEASKAGIEKMVEGKFKVHVMSVKIINLKAKTKTQPSRKGYFQTSGMKKAIVQLKKGEKIALFEVAEKDAETEDVEVRTAEGEVLGKSKEKKSLLRGTKVKIEKNEVQKEHPTEHMHTQQGGKTSGKAKGGAS